MKDTVNNTQRKERKGISLIKKSKKGFAKVIFSRVGLMFLLLLLQVIFMVVIFVAFGESFTHVYGISVAFSFVMVIYILNTSLEPTTKITWLFVIMLLPVFGSLLFLYNKREVGHRALRKRVNDMVSKTNDQLDKNEEILKEYEKFSPSGANLARYIGGTGAYPVYKNTKVTYFPLGEDKFKEMLVQLEKAEKFIFLEYFIVDEGTMWGEILEILARKVKEGVDVRMMYDGTCEFTTLPHNYPKMLSELGIKCRAFAPLMPFLSTHYNYRDHRKILVIDGKIAFNGGINLADEYINGYVKYGHWKDTAVMLEGEAVRSFTLMFLQMWSLDEVKNKEFDFREFLKPVPKEINEKGYVIPYGDCPLDDDRVGEHVYIDMLNRAVKYVHIMTPYLILDGETEDALEFAAKRGVDVRIILPGIPDKKVPYALALTHYKVLLAAGVKIYEYTPGFVHAKVFVCDDKEAVVGTINLDYRSLYHHFECATYMNSVECIGDIEEDFENTQAKCKEVTKENIKDQKFMRKAIGFFVKPLSPLL